MKKGYLRLLALLICAVMVLGMVPGKAQAVALDEVRMPQQRQITMKDKLEWGYDIHCFTEFADLIELAAVATADPDTYYECAYDGTGSFTFPSDYAIPENLAVWFTGDIVIPAGVTLKVNGSLYPRNMDIQGNCVVAPNGWVSCSDIYVSGSLLVDDGEIYTTIDNQITGIDKISFKEMGRIHLQSWFASEAELRQLLEHQRITNGYWRYDFSAAVSQIHFASPVTIPKEVDIGFNWENTVVSGAPITVYGTVNVNVFDTDMVIKNDLILAEDSGFGLYGFNTDNYIILEGDVTVNCRMNVNAPVIFKGNVTINNYMNVYNAVTFEGAVKNNYAIQIAAYNGGKTAFQRPDLYNDQVGEDWGAIYVMSDASQFPAETVAGLDINNFQDFGYYPDDAWIPYWGLGDYKLSSEPSVHEHTVVVDGAVAPTCLTGGKTEGSHCATCGEVFVKQENLAPLGHDYGLDANGNIDFYDTTCDVCGAERIVDPTRLTHSMYRMFNPNTGEHFYTGDKTERQNLEAAGWKFEGVGFTFPANTGAPVYRLFQPSTGEHLYTMDVAEKDYLAANGWNVEGVAFNSATSSEVPQYRLHNPNVSVGAYHFTASAEERDVLLAAGWEDQGIGFYTCWQ